MGDHDPKRKHLIITRQQGKARATVDWSWTKQDKRKARDMRQTVLALAEEWSDSDSDLYELVHP